MSKFGILSITLLISVGAAFGQPAEKKGQPSEKKQTTTKAAAASAKDTLPPGVPKDAIEVEPYYWKATDKEGVTWIYHTTPFGLVKDKAPHDEVTGKVITDTPTPGEITVTDKGGDVLGFSRPTPFGNSVWTTKKTLLNKEEAAAWAKYKEEKAAAAANSNSKR